MNRSQLSKMPGGRVEIRRPHPMMKLLDDSASELDVNAVLPEKVSMPANVPDNNDSAAEQVADLSLADGCQLMVLGAGSVGGYIAYFIAGAFKAAIYLLDFDILETRNTRAGRSIYKPGFTGMKKVYAAREIIEADFPGSRIIPLSYNIMDVPDIELLRLARQCSVVICAIDDARAMFRINKLLYNKITILYPAMHNSARTGHIIVTTPGKSACLQCSMDIDDPGQIQTLHGEPGWGLDIRNVANHCATAACQIIHANTSKQDINRWDPEKNIFYFSNARNNTSPDGPGILLEAAEKRKGCPVCSLSTP